MADEKMGVPKLRLPGFADPWERRELGELFTERSEKGRDDLPALTIIQGGGTIRRSESERILQYDKKSLNTYKVVNPDDFIVHLRSFEGGLEKATCCGLVSPAYHVFRGDQVNADFYYLYFRSSHFTEIDLKPYIYGIRDGRSIDIQGLKKMPIPWTSAEEQRQIGALFGELDDLIALRQRELDHLQMQKRGLIQKMFPKDGSRVPELRFPGFTDPWEQRRLGELCSFAKGRGYSKADICDSGTPLILYGRLYTRYQTRIEEVDTFAAEQDGSLFSKGCEVIVPAFGETAEDIAVASSVRSPGIMLGGDLNVVTPSREIDPDFLAIGITYGRAHSDLAKRAQGKSVVHIHGEDIADMSFTYPGIREQRAISSFILNFDDLIALHLRELNHLKLQKKALIQQMFVWGD